jgi:hypothetical protein
MRCSACKVALPGFNTGGREPGTGPGREALLMLSTRNLTGSTAVHINNVHVGMITATPPGAVFTTQLISVPGEQLQGWK